MNDLIIPPTIREVFPNFEQGFREALRIFNRIQSFEDVELYLMKGQGLAESSYRTYMTSVRQLYKHTDSLNPLQVTPNHVEDFFDKISQTVGAHAAYNKMQGLKRFFNGVQRLVPGFVSPFEIMPERLTKKLFKSPRNKKKKALNKREARALLKYLSRDKSRRGKEVYAMVFLLMTSGLRAGEFCQLRWKDIEHYDGKYTARFTQKGGDQVEQELYSDAVKAARKVKRGEYLFYVKDGKYRLRPHSLWAITKELGEKARAEGIIQREMNFSPHLFRRTYATLLYRDNMKPVAIMEKTRHKTLDVLVKHYLDDSEEAAPHFQSIFAGVVA